MRERATPSAGMLRTRVGMASFSDPRPVAPPCTCVPVSIIPCHALQAAELAIEASRNSTLCFGHSILHANAG